MMRLAQFLTGRSGRERLALALAVLLALPAALWLALAEPLLARRDAARTALAEAEELHAWLIEQRETLASLPAAPRDGAERGDIPAAEGLAGIEARLQDAGLTEAALGAGLQLSDAGGGAIGLRFERVGFLALMDWIEAVEAEAGYRLASLTLGPDAEQPGEVAAELRFVPLGQERGP